MKTNTISLQLDDNRQPIPGIIVGSDVFATRFEVRDPMHIDNAASEEGAVATILSDGSLDLSETQAIALGMFMFRCAGVADGFPSLTDVQKVFSNVSWAMEGQPLANRWMVKANVDLASKLVETSMERDQLKLNADGLQDSLANLIVTILKSIRPDTIVYGGEGDTARDATTMIKAIRESTDEGRAYVRQAYTLALYDLQQKLTRNPTVLQTSTDPRIVWKPHATGFYMHIGPVHLQVYRRGKWVAAASHPNRTTGNSMMYADDLEDEIAAKKAALRMAREFLEQDAASTMEALDNLCFAGGGPETEGRQ